MNINENAIEELTKLIIKDSFESKENKECYKLTKQDLMRFSVKLIKTIERYRIS